jgi:electron transport complex protein RnfA|tara:strand:+ start:165 stop:746 length:582 start_codon:yes stop_codon:yes gene_type:complete
VSNLLAIFITLAIIQNFIVVQFLGLCPFFGVTKRLRDAFSMGVALIIVMTVAGAAGWIITEYVLKPYNVVYLNNVVYILVIATMVQITEMFIKRTNATLYNSFGIYLPLITTNCAVLGLLFINLKEEYNFAEAIFSSIGSAVGFMLVMAIMAGIREKLDIADPPRSFRGLPQAIFVAMMLGLIFGGFTGVVKI